jgi:hypothetical protein
MTGSGSQSDLELRGLSFESVPGDNPLPDQAGQEDDHELEEKDIHLPPRLPQSRNQQEINESPSAKTE